MTANLSSIVNRASLFKNEESNTNNNSSNSELDNRALFEKLDRDIDIVDNELNFMQQNNIQTLASVTLHQKEIALKMAVNIGSEALVAYMLAESMEAYSQQLLAISESTAGGLIGFTDAMKQMFESIFGDGSVDGTELEDAFQLALMDVIMHPENYNLTSQQMEDIQHFLEATGSGSHGVHEGYDGDRFAALVSDLFDTIQNQAPDGSLAKQILDALSQQYNCPQALQDQFANNWGTITDWQADWQSGQDLSPLMRMVILSSLLSGGELTVEEYQLIISGDLQDINQLINRLHPSINNIVDYINQEVDGWNIHIGNDPNQGFGMNYGSSEGVTSNYFNTLSENLPQRPLTDEEIKEINRIGDQVKMIQQTLKYWLQVVRDEQLSVARNI
ncbi:hypothetical protein [Vibrio aestuarianus]|uniref:hypothetical protein n=1 Tax=Vibrio aestuarianus TaxID=28171 RepID=UPI00237C933E|nr:hypothetical protein [Vibrio aestuarianus]MDE1265077.1 hypothetical protein [Vibrio aestuarianus]MDE1297005.1 hypothetical protein [Vibrio aestuarianus]